MSVRGDEPEKRAKLDRMPGERIKPDLKQTITGNMVIPNLFEGDCK